MKTNVRGRERRTERRMIRPEVRRDGLWALSFSYLCLAYLFSIILSSDGSFVLSLNFFHETHSFQFVCSKRLAAS